MGDQTEDAPRVNRQSPETGPGLANTSTGNIEPAAPIAQMIGSEDAASLAEATIGVVNGTHTLSGRRLRPVERQGFVDTTEFVEEAGSESQSPAPTERSNASPRGSPELGTPSWAQSQLGDLQNASTVPEPVSAEEPRLSTEDAIQSREESDARRAMPPPPIPLPRSPARATPKLPRISIKYRIQKSPGVFRVWNPRDTFKSLSMDELQTIHGFQDVESVQFILQRRGMSWDDLVPKDDNVAFQDMKIRFEDKISDDYDEIGETRGVVYYDILIVPVRNTEDSRESVREQRISL
ncbi:uncharacterized protein FTOL_03918 [Fusarium torulosum]|uniref:Uncharacterized protein n=1 Tax=Fusarium torulosum TaxID=33205 RepID=A0AAE8SFQ4_9HYPO|nr:uncharacterized protein FTOL_03918 [Fusarium torulosum]